MALVKCKECQAEISSEAFDCPKCGAKLKKPSRTLLGKIVKYTFILFNVFMAWWLIAGVGGASEQVSEASSEAAKAGAAIGTGLGAFMVMTIWVFGDIILGLFMLFTRPKK